MSQNTVNSLQMIQAELKAPKNRQNNFGKYSYRSCEDILEAVKPHLAKHGCTLTLSDDVKEIANIVIIEAKATFTDANGQTTVVTASAGVDIQKKGMDVAQTFGASSSYARKYALNGLFLIDDNKDYDSDEYHHQVQNQQQRQAPQQQSRQAPQQQAPQQQMDDEYHRALNDIQNAQNREVLTQIRNYFQGAPFFSEIEQAIKDKVQAMGWGKQQGARAS